LRRFDRIGLQAQRRKDKRPSHSEAYAMLANKTGYVTNVDKRFVQGYMYKVCLWKNSANNHTI